MASNVSESDFSVCSVSSVVKPEHYRDDSRTDNHHRAHRGNEFVGISVPSVSSVVNTEDGSAAMKKPKPDAPPSAGAVTRKLGPALY
jgi:hypothetical protein